MIQFPTIVKNHFAIATTNLRFSVRFNHSHPTFQSGPCQCQEAGVVLLLCGQMSKDGQIIRVHSLLKQTMQVLPSWTSNNSKLIETQQFGTGRLAQGWPFLGLGTRRPGRMTHISHQMFSERSSRPWLESCWNYLKFFSLAASTHG